MSGISANKKILLTVVAFILVIAALVGVLLITDSNSGKTENEPTTAGTLLNLPTVASESNTGENASSAFSQSVSTTSASSSAANTSSMTEMQQQCVQAFLSSNYYISASFVTDGASSDMDMAVRGKDFQATIESDGMVLTVMIIDSKVYFVNNSTRTYFEMSKTLLSTMGFNIEDLQEIQNEIDFSGYVFTSVDKTTEELDGTTVECFKYYNDQIAVTFKFDGNELKRIVFSDAQGNAASTMVVRDYTPYVPTGMLTLSGLQKSRNMISFFMDMAG